MCRIRLRDAISHGIADIVHSSDVEVRQTTKRITTKTACDENKMDFCGNRMPDGFRAFRF